MAFTQDKDLLELIDAAVNDQEKARQLIKDHPDLLKRRNNLEETALHFLAVENYPTGVHFLCQNGAEVDPVDFSGATPLTHAATLGHEEVVEVLLSYGANPNATDGNEESALSCVKRTGNQRIVKMLVKGANAEHTSAT